MQAPVKASSLFSSRPLLRCSRARVICESAALQPPLAPVPEPEIVTSSRNVAIFVEPSPFSHVSGMKNRFECLIRTLREQGDDVIVFTPDRTPPKHFHGAKVRHRSCAPPVCNVGADRANLCVFATGSRYERCDAARV
jgi:hypothetical protein